MQVVGLNKCFAGAPLADGVTLDFKVSTLTAITQPYSGGVTLNFSNPTKNKFHREGEADPFASIADVKSGSKEVQWNVADFDKETKEFYFGTTEAEKGQIYEGEKAFAFVSKSNTVLVFARLNYSAILAGGMNASDPLQIAVSAEVLAPANGGKSWDVLPYAEEAQE